MNYRFDNRDKEQFEKDIKEHTLEERALFLLWLDMVENSTGIRPIYRDTGCGKTGDFLEESEVSTDPDFEVEGFGKIEVKFSKPLLKTCFHLKASQVKKYIALGATILMVNGSSEKVPQFTLLSTDALTKIAKECKVVDWPGFGNKASYRIPIKNFIWRPLK